jgi:hypothetical protein
MRQSLAAIHQPYRFPVHLQFPRPHSEHSTSIFLFVKGTLCQAILGFMWLPVIPCRGELPYTLCPCENFQTMKCLCLRMNCNYINCSHHFISFIGYIPHTYTKFDGNAMLYFQVLYEPKSCQGLLDCECHTTLHLLLPVIKLYSCCIVLLPYQYCISTLCTYWLLTADNTTEITLAIFKMAILLINFHSLIKVNMGAQGSAVGWGTALQAGRSQVWFLMVSMEFTIDIIYLATLWPWG